MCPENPPGTRPRRGVICVCPHPLDGKFLNNAFVGAIPGTIATTQMGALGGATNRQVLGAGERNQKCVCGVWYKRDSHRHISRPGSSTYTRGRALDSDVVSVGYCHRVNKVATGYGRVSDINSEGGSHSIFPATTAC
jgi:hypothetical protein